MLGKTVRELENELSVRELGEWKQYYSKSLFPMERQEIQMAQQLSMISSYMGGKPKITDFLFRQRNKLEKSSSALTDKVKGIFGKLL